MKRTKLFILTFLFACNITAHFCAQENNEYGSLDTLQLFKKDQQTFVLFDSTNVRISPSLNGEIITQLPIGTQVVIISKSTNCLYLNGVVIPWYKIKFGKNQEGYIWGGKLALSAEKSAKNIRILFLFGIEKGSHSNLTYIIKAVQNFKEINSISISGFTGTRKEHQLEVISNKGLEEIDDIINIHGYGQFCGDDAGLHVIFWTKQKLHYVTKLVTGFDAPSFYTESFVYPSHIEGMKGIILKHIVSGEYLDDLTDDWSQPAKRLDQDTFIRYKWNGTQLIELN